MILLLDIGNSNVKWAVLDNGQLGSSTAASHRGQTIAKVLSQTGSTLTRPDEVWLANVAGNDADQVVIDWVAEHWSCPLHIATPQTQACAVTNGYCQPSQLGVDRWLGLIACYAAEKKAACVVSCGTAITADVIDADGKHLGGFILPGLNMAQDALNAGTHDIKTHNSLQSVSSLDLATDTGTAISHGAMYAAAAFIDKLCADMEQTLSITIELIITGGDAELVLPLITRRAKHQPQLVMQGLVRLRAECQ